MEASEAIQSEIDKQLGTDSTASSASASVADASATAAPVGTHSPYSDLFRQHLERGCRNPLELLTKDEAESLMGCPIATPSTTGEEEYIGAHYGCMDDRSMYVALCVSSLMPWDYIRDEVSTESAPQSVGDEALVSGEVLYVRQGESFFWLFGRGVESAVVYSIARHVANRLSS